MSAIDFNEEFFTEQEDIALIESKQYPEVYEKISLIQMIDVLPDDAEAFVNKLLKDIPTDEAAGHKKLVEIARKKPEYFEQLMAFYFVMNSKRLKADGPTIAKVDSNVLTEAKYQDSIDDILNALKSYK